MAGKGQAWLIMPFKVGHTIRSCSKDGNYSISALALFLLLLAFGVSVIIANNHTTHILPALKTILKEPVMIIFMLVAIIICLRLRKCHQSVLSPSEDPSQRPADQYAIFNHIKNNMTLVGVWTFLIAGAFADLLKVASNIQWIIQESKCPHTISTSIMNSCYHLMRLGFFFAIASLTTQLHGQQVKPNYRGKMWYILFFLMSAIIINWYNSIQYLLASNSDSINDTFPWIGINSTEIICHTGFQAEYFHNASPYLYSLNIEFLVLAAQIILSLIIKMFNSTEKRPHKTGNNNAQHRQQQQQQQQRQQQQLMSNIQPDRVAQSTTKRASMVSKSVQTESNTSCMNKPNSDIHIDMSISVDMQNHSNTLRHRKPQRDLDRAKTPTGSVISSSGQQKSSFKFPLAFVLGLHVNAFFIVISFMGVFSTNYEDYLMEYKVYKTAYLTLCICIIFWAYRLSLSIEGSQKRRRKGNMVAKKKVQKHFLGMELLVVFCSIGEYMRSILRMLSLIFHAAGMYESGICDSDVTEPATNCTTARIKPNVPPDVIAIMIIAEVSNIAMAFFKSTFIMYCARLIWPNQKKKRNWNKWWFKEVLLFLAMESFTCWMIKGFIDTARNGKDVSYNNVPKFYYDGNTWTVVSNLATPVIVFFHFNAFFIFLATYLDT